MEANSVLEVRNVKKSFPGTMALKGVSLSLKQGEIRAVVGENGAGKSTLMNVISGVLPLDEGEILVKGKSEVFKGPAEAAERGIGFVHQELALCPVLTVAQNVFMGHLPESGGGMIDQKKLYHDTEQLLEKFDVTFGPNDRLMGMSTAEQQIVEIAHALSLHCEVLILDEPTSSLNEAETERLFQVVRKLQADGMAILYISHKLSEIFDLCETVTVMRNGEVIDTHNITDITPEQLTSEMVGRPLNNLYPPKTGGEPGEILLQAEHIKSGSKVLDGSFTLRRGEILGISGLLGSGRTELAKAVCGIDRCQSGTVRTGDGEHSFHNYREALEQGICYLTEDRKGDGLFLRMSIRDNISAMIMKENSKATILNHKKLGEISQEYAEKLRIKANTIQQSAGSLSGGNQQKVLIAKLLAMKPKVVFMDEPTRGIDVGAKYEIHALLRELCAQGVGIVVISSEFPEIVGVCDRFMVMHEGRTVAELVGGEITQENLIHCASGNN